MWCSFSTAANSRFGLSLAAGYATSDSTPLRIGLQKSWSVQWRKHCPWKVGGYWELSTLNLHHPRENVNISAASGIIRAQKQGSLSSHPVYPFFDIGIGFAKLSHRDFLERKLGTRGQFEDRIGFGLLFGTQKQFECAYRWIHFSNGYLAQSNHGLNLHILSLGYWF